MELFIPSLVILILGAIVCIAILPRMSPYTLGLLAIALFTLGVWQHYSMFPYEYTFSSSLDVLKNYSGFIMSAAVILGGVILVMLMHGGSPPSVTSLVPTSINSLLPANMGIGNTSNSKSIFGGINSAKRNNIASTSFKVV